ncbi:hypothetical protein ACWOC1_02075 [Enterococcus quebecensis]|uniref:Gram-positive cocci surface proteins LPxTG domain-containing protein n=1 Tax=Enterococcus quebecensis TaxID=903983 RepID=A0A1E5H3A0_9ENTE|nr:hypothetical protein [Enterococcus quebecensis]OEG19391.1 hypothetical protein BCR23_01510 [Enterococcus quebecensis]OJG75685.1 hypothetical protein RV12_GL000024 [Enterococcus quebecensis]
MKNQYFLWSLILLIYVCFASVSSTTYALAEKERTETGISFDQFVEPEKNKPPIYETKSIAYPNTSGALPHLGQMMTSFLLLLVGIGCLIVFVGVISLRKVYNITI